MFDDTSSNMREKKTVTWDLDVRKGAEDSTRNLQSNPRNIPAECLQDVIETNTSLHATSHLKRYAGFARECRRKAAEERHILRDLRLKMASEPAHTQTAYVGLARAAASRHREFTEEARLFDALTVGN